MTDAGTAPPPIAGRFDPSGGFCLATGIECSAPVIADDGRRNDQLRKTGHRERYAEDARITRRFGIGTLRYGIPFHEVAARPGRFDWSWTDGALRALDDADVEPIVDLLHFGVPEDLAGISDPRLPERYLAYVEAFVERYPQVRCYTPVNEPLITAALSARAGHWNERTTDEPGYVRALTNLGICGTEAMRIIRAHRADAAFLVNDVCERHEPAEPAAEAEARRRNEHRFLGLDLSLGRLPEPETCEWLAANGLEPARLEALVHAGRAAAANVVVGLDYYPGNEHLVAADGTDRPMVQRGFASVAHDYLDRYGLPLMLAETNTVAEAAPGWLRETWNATAQLVAEGVPVRGFCWYSLTDQVDWDTGLREDAGRVNSLGLVDLDRCLRPVGRLYRRLAARVAAGDLRALPRA